MKRKFLKFVLWLFSLIAFLVLTGIVVSKYSKNHCRKIEILIYAPDDATFITRDDVMSYIRESKDSIVNNELGGINVEKLEGIIMSKPFVQKAKVYMTIDARLKVEITQRTPIVRVQPDIRLAGISGIEYNPYFISSDGSMMPLVPGKTERVIFANGNIRNLYNNFLRLDVDSARIAEDTAGLFTTLYAIYHVADFISKDKFLKAQIQQIYVDENKDLILVPEVGRHIVIFGDGNDMNAKFKKLKIFYEKAAFIKGWDKYDTINVKYKNQIICS